MDVGTSRQDGNCRAEQVANFRRLSKHATLGSLANALEWMAMLAYQTTAEEHDGYGNMLQVPSTPSTSGITEMLEEDV